MADGEADDVGLDLLERAKVTVDGVERHARRAGDRLVAARLAERRRESVRRPVKRDWIAICGKWSAVSEVPSH